MNIIKLLIMDNNKTITQIKKVISANQAEYAKYHFLLASEMLYSWQRPPVKDLETGMILAFLTVQALKIFNQNNKNKSYEKLINEKQIDIGKIKLAEIARQLNIPRETLRRKINKLKQFKFIKNENRHCIVLTKSFSIESRNLILSKYAKCLNIIKLRLKGNTLIKKKDETNEKELNEFYSKVWHDILSMQCQLVFLWRKLDFIETVESYFIFGICSVNQMYNLKKYKSFVHKNTDNIENFFLNITEKDTIRGLNPTTISDLTGIPRQTVIRNLNVLIKRKVLKKEKKKNLFFIPRDTTQKKLILNHYKKITEAIASNTFQTLQFI